MSYFIDTHTHLYDEAFNGDFDDTVRRAFGAGVKQFVFPDIDSSCRNAMLECASRFPDNIFCTTGLHPTSVGTDWKEELLSVQDALESGVKWCGIGEIGLDCHWSREFLKEQKEVFDTQLFWAESKGLPVIIHSRESTAEILDILEAHKGRGLTGVFHAYSGSTETYCSLERYGNFFIGIGGVVTYRNSKLPQLLQNVPLSRVLLETDSPYLTPVPHRGERNESAYIPIIAARIALAIGTDTDNVAAVTSQNAKSLFCLPLPGETLNQYNTQA